MFLLFFQLHSAHLVLWIHVRKTEKSLAHVLNRLYLLNIQHAKSSNTKAKLNNQQCNFESVLQTFNFNRSVNHADGEVAFH